MKVAYRVAGPGDVGRWNGDFAQLSVYRNWEGSIENMHRCVGLLRDRGIRYVMHPVNYSLIGGKEEVEAVKLMAGLSDLALILHDERAPDGARLSGEHEDRFLGVLKELEEITTVSFENANNTHDAPWFWDRFARRVTLDIGHVEGAGLNSVEYVESLPDVIVEKIDYVHMHHNNGFRGGLTDHWPLRAGCRELQALRRLLERRTEFSVILEINEVEEISHSIELIRDLWKDVKGE